MFEKKEEWENLEGANIKKIGMRKEKKSRGGRAYFFS
jgi:hypothetical protein